MRNFPLAELQRHVAAFHSAGMIQYTEAQRRHAEEAIDPVPYFIIPSAAARSQRLRTIVTSFVHLDHRGMLPLNAPKAYGLVERPTIPGVEYSAKRLEAAHVIAEDMALRRGLWTPYGRAAAELYVAEKVAEPGNAGTYVQDRILHLNALADEVQEEDVFRHVGDIVGELELATESLRTYAQDRGFQIDQ